MTPEVTTLIKLETVADLDGAKRFDDQQKKSQRTINSVTKDLKIQERMLRKKGRSYNYVKASVSGATKEELKAILAMEKNIARMKQSEAAMQKQNKTLRMMRGGFGQVGHQIQDVAVQLQGGTDAMIVFGQQGSQIVSLFGPQGAMIGAILAVGAALATGLKSGIDEATKDLDDFVDATREQAEELGILTQAQKDFNEATKAAKIEKLAEDQSGFSDQVAKTEEKIKTLQNFLDVQVAVLSKYGKEVVDNDGNIQSLRDQLESYNETLTDQKNNLDNTTQALSELKDGTLSTVAADKERLETINELIRAATEQAHTVGMSAREQALYKATVEGANQTQLDAISHMYDLIEAHEDAEKAAKKQAKANEEASKAALKAIEAEAKARRKANNEEIDYFTGTLGQILSLSEDKKLAAEMEAQERLNVAKEALDRQLLDETSYAEAVFAIHRDLHNKIAEIKGTSGQGPERTIVDIGTDFDALMEAQKTELDLFKEHQAKKLELVNEHEQAINDVMIDYNEIRKQINDETNAYMMAANMTAMSSIVGSAKQQVDTLSGFFDQASGIGKAFYVVSQAMAAADAIIQGYVTSANIKTAYAKLAATTGNPALATAGEAHAAMAIGMGFATAAAIAGQTVASFEGGGMTFSGVRSGGMDGKGGRLAMVHPNEKITDMEKGGGPAQPVNVNINISAVDAKGVDELLVKRRGMITNLVRNSLANSGSRLG